jgi:MoaA/NifB/PqqE/SkfB family radical SAM enzyme
MTLVDDRQATTAPAFVWLDLTRRCSLACVQCYNDSGPQGDHGAMTREDWFGVLDQACAAGVARVQLIGGEPTLHPDFAAILAYALGLGLRVEVFSNLVHVKPEWWELFRRSGVSLATSYYSDIETEHNAVTGRDSHRKTRANVARAVELGIALRCGVIAVRPGQRVEAARADLLSLGVTRVGTDRMRHIGRGEQGHGACDVNELCGRCGHGRAAVGPDGAVTPCVMAGWLVVGNVRAASLADILVGAEMARAIGTISQPAGDPCDPGAQCRPDAYPCYPQNG